MFPRLLAARGGCSGGGKLRKSLSRRVGRFGARYSNHAAAAAAANCLAAAGAFYLDEAAAASRSSLQSGCQSNWRLGRESLTLRRRPAQVSRRPIGRTAFGRRRRPIDQSGGQLSAKWRASCVARSAASPADFRSLRANVYDLIIHSFSRLLRPVARRYFMPSRANRCSACRRRQSLPANDNKNSLVARL